MKKLLFVALICGTLLSSLACGGPTWCHPTHNTVQDFERDKFECEGSAYAMTSDYGDAGNPFMILDFFKRCMRIKGWYECND